MHKKFRHPRFPMVVEYKYRLNHLKRRKRRIKTHYTVFEFDHLRSRWPPQYFPQSPGHFVQLIQVQDPTVQGLCNPAVFVTEVTLITLQRRGQNKSRIRFFFGFILYYSLIKKKKHLLPFKPTVS